VSGARPELTTVRLIFMYVKALRFLWGVGAFPLQRFLPCVYVCVFVTI
jgi:hypothetical protein